MLAQTYSPQRNFNSDFAICGSQTSSQTVTYGRSACEANPAI